MKKVILLLTLLLQIGVSYSQDNSFSFIGKHKDEVTLLRLADSLKVPLLIAENKIYAIGGDCITRDLGGNATGREEDGDENDREKDGSTNSREKGGGVGERDKKGKANQRGKDGNIGDRDKEGKANQRDVDGGSALGTRCGVTKGGKLLLYTREHIKAKQSKIFYSGKFYSNKYYKIIQL